MSGDLLSMLKWSMIVWRLQRPYVKGSRLHQEALQAGIEGIRADYGDSVVADVKSKLERCDWRSAGRGLLTLIRYYPRGAWSVFTGKKRH